MRASQLKLNPSLKKEIINTFIQLVADLRDVEEARTFLENFFNDIELETYAKRVAIAYWLKKGRSYENIKNNLKVSSATIAATQSMLESDGLKLAIKKIEAEEWANKWAEKIKSFTG